MKPKERVEIALKGGKPDRVPIVPIYDIGYVMRSLGRDPRQQITATTEESVQIIEENFLLHEVDGIFVHYGNSDEWAKTHIVEKTADHWMVTHKETGDRYRLLPDGWCAEEDGTPIPRAPSSGGVSLIQTPEDIDALVSAPPQEEVELTGRYAPLRHLISKYPDHHFSFQSGSPMVGSLNACGGYVEGLVTMKADRKLYRQLMARLTEAECARIAPGRKTGAHSTWFTCYYTGADTISPKDYAEIVFPYEYEVCREAKAQGLYVLNWFLGDLMPILDKVMELPIDALVLEQGRKGYDIDPVEIRKRVGPDFCLFGFGYEMDYVTNNREALRQELQRQIEGAGRDGAFIAGTPIMPPDAQPAAVDYYFSEARRLGRNAS